MRDEQLRAMTVDELRARFSFAPDYYLQSILERKKVLEKRMIRETKKSGHGKKNGARKATVTRDKKKPNLILVVNSSK